MLTNVAASRSQHAVTNAPSARTAGGTPRVGTESPAFFHDSGLPVDVVVLDQRRTRITNRNSGKFPNPKHQNSGPIDRSKNQYVKPNVAYTQQHVAIKNTTTTTIRRSTMADQDHNTAKMNGRF